MNEKSTTGFPASQDEVRMLPISPKGWLKNSNRSN